MLKKSRKFALLTGMMFGAVIGVILFNSRFNSILFWSIAVVSAFMGFKYGSKGPRWKTLGYLSYGVAFSALIYGFLLE